jgi:thioredoxin-related protein
MEQRGLAASLLIFVIFIFGGIVAYDVFYGRKSNKTPQQNQPIKNWNWKDEWSEGVTPGAIMPKLITPPLEVIPGPVQITASTYQEALKKSAEIGKPVFVFFTADWCTWCKKMKSETMADARVKSQLTNYVLVYVDTDREKLLTRRMKVENLPSYMIVTSKEQKVMSGNGYKTTEELLGWISGSNPSKPKNQND